MKVVGDKVNTPQIRCYHSADPRVTPYISFLKHISPEGFLAQIYLVRDVISIDNKDAKISKMTIWWARSRTDWFVERIKFSDCFDQPVSLISLAGMPFQIYRSTLNHALH